MNPEPAFRIHGKPDLDKPALIVGWMEDAGKIGVRFIDFLLSQLACREFGEILPEGFFPMAGVVVEDDVAQFPESKFYVCDEKNLVIFKSNTPRSDWHRFIRTVLDVAQKDCGVREVYTVGAMVSYAAHTMPRPLISVVNLPAMKDILFPLAALSNSDYETPPGQKPTLNSYLLWVARERNLPGVNLWVPVPYYFVPLNDPRACMRLADFFNLRFNLGLEFHNLSAEMDSQDQRIHKLFAQSPEIEGYVRKLEIGEALNTEESEKLAQSMAEYLKGIS